MAATTVASPLDEALAFARRSPLAAALGVGGAALLALIALRPLSRGGADPEAAPTTLERIGPLADDWETTVPDYFGDNAYLSDALSDALKSVGFVREWVAPATTPPPAAAPTEPIQQPRPDQLAGERDYIGSWPIPSMPGSVAPIIDAPSLREPDWPGTYERLPIVQPELVERPPTWGSPMGAR